MYAAPTEGEGLRLHLNENTAGASPAVLDALRSLTRVELARYPDYTRVTTLAARYLGVDSEWLALTNGLDEGLHAVSQAAAVAYWREPASNGRPSGTSDAPEALIIEPAFEMYRACAEAAGLDAVAVEPDDGPACSVASVQAALTPRTRLVYLNDPNNPSGLALPAELRERIGESAPQTDVLLDEAYAEFSGRTGVGAVLGGDRRLVIGRTFAKAFGLAGLRAGAVIAHPDTLARIRRVLPPYGLNVCAARGLEAALGDLTYMRWYVAQAEHSRRLIYDACARLGLPYWRSDANFVLIQIGADASDVVRALGDRGVLVRDRSAVAGCGGCLRLTAGVVEHTQIALARLEDVLASRRR